ncbi:MAG: hypothetical protein VX527_09820 [Planctomycetota bacterium]|nr:hypothetical protein [Planctomycetota bacterium]
MKTMFLFFSMLLIALTQASCIMAARKGLGTIVGPHGSMTIVSDHGDIQPGETIRSVRVQNLIGSQANDNEISALQSSIEKEMSRAGLLDANEGSLVLVMNLTRYTDRPAKKELQIRADITRDGSIEAVAVLKADLNGFGDKEAVREAIDKAAVRFCNEVGMRGS